VPADLGVFGGAEGGAGVDPSAGYKDSSLMMDLLLEEVMEDEFDNFPPLPETTTLPSVYPYSSAFAKTHPVKKPAGATAVSQQNGEMDMMQMIQSKR
jgi:hypothetical protein